VAETEPARPESLRLFFALWPDEATRTALHHTGGWLHRQWGGRRMRAAGLHLTLAFLGATPAERLDALVACANAVQADGYDLVLDRAGCWRHARIGWLGAQRMPPQHAALADALNERLRVAHFPVDSRSHVPHVTLLRNTSGGDIPECRPVSWAVREFVLAQSVTEPDGAHYRVIRRWPLGPGHVGASRG
jgi:2'-5' RNA ligase